MRAIYLLTEEKYRATGNSIQFAALHVHWIAKKMTSFKKSICMSNGRNQGAK
jgi:hypothetical protein